MHRLAPIVVAALALFLAGCGDGNDSTAVTETPSGGSLRVIELGYDGGTLRVEVAEKASDRQLGLGGRPSLDEGAGMLFVLEATRVPSFSMRGMQFPLDFIWIDESKRVMEVTRNVPPPSSTDAPLESISPGEPVRYVLELNAGAAARAGIDEGDALEFTLE